MKRFLLALALGACIPSANAALIERLDGLAYYDDVLDITWAQNAYATSGSYGDVRAYIAGLTIGGVSGWRLPKVDIDGNDVIQRCSLTVSDCLDNEFAHHFWNNGVSVEEPGVFSNVQRVYWTNDYSTVPGQPYSYYMSLTFRGHSNAYTWNAFYAWAVRDGDVAPIPIPAAAWLFGSAMGLLGWIRSRRTSRT